MVRLFGSIQLLQLGRYLQLGTLCIAVLFMGACATGPDTDPVDPLEPLNRKINTFNEVLDGTLLKPAAQVYEWATPEIVVGGVSNFFSNLKEVWSIPNSILQFKILDAIESTMRVAVNAVFGFGGFLDFATEVGMQRHEEDLGQTLAYWGIPSGPYLVLPFFGPGTVRGSASIVLQNALSLTGAVARQVRPGHAIPTRYQLGALDVIDTRALLLPGTDFIDATALDPYIFIRDAYLQRRQALIQDGAIFDQEEPVADVADPL